MNTRLNYIGKSAGATEVLFKREQMIPKYTPDIEAPNIHIRTSTIPKRFPSTFQDRYITYEECIVNMMIQMELEFAEQLDIERLSRAIHLVLDAEPILGCRYVPHWRKPYWERLDTTKAEVFIFTKKQDEYEKFKLESIDCRVGPQIKCCLLRSATGDHLLLKVAHQVSDAGGVKEIASIISDLYSKLANDPDYYPKSNLNASRGIWQVIRNIPWYAHLGSPYRLARDYLPLLIPPDTHTLPIKADSRRAPLSYILRHIPVDQVSNLVKYGKKRNATINDMIQTAYIRTLVLAGNWNGQNQLRSWITIDLRRYLPSRRGEAVANLSMLSGCHLGKDLGQDFDSTLGKITTITKRQKDGWIGFDLALGSSYYSIVPDSWSMKLFQSSFQLAVKMGNPPNSLTNMGPIDPNSVTFDTRPLKAWLLVPPGYPPLLLPGLSGYCGALTLSVGVYPAQKAIAERFMDQLLLELPIDRKE